MKTFVTALSLLFCMATVQAATIKERATALVNNMEKVLALSPDQKTKVYEFVVQKMENQDKLIAAGTGPEADRKNVQYEKRKFIGELRNYITTEQYNKWILLRQKQVEQMNKGEKIEIPIIDKDLDLNVK